MGKKKRPTQRTSGPGAPGQYLPSEVPGEDEPAPVVLPKAPERISSPFRDALGPLKKQLEIQAKEAKEAGKKPVPPKGAPQKLAPNARPFVRDKPKAPKLEGDEATALSMAMHGVVPLGKDKSLRVGSTPRVESRTAKVVPFGESAEQKARARLDSLVAEDVNFRIESDDTWVSGVRSDASPRLTRELARRTRAGDTLDLHGLGAREAREAVATFVRKAHRRGLDVVCIVHGKGQHSEGGVGVLRDVVVRALTDTGAAPLVFAFVTAHEALGGSGALAVELKH